jgi:hypothetical protein
MKPIETANDVLIDILEDNRRRTKRAVKDLDDACLYWSSDGEANNIAVTLWHMGRLLDVFFVRQAHGKPAAEECWIRNGWAERTGYNPHGIGRDGWGSVNGYTQEEVAAIPRMTTEQLLAYLDEVYDTVNAYFEATSIDAMQAKAPGFDGQFTIYQCIQMALLDNIRHLGEIITIKALWERQQT